MFSVLKGMYHFSKIKKNVWLLYRGGVYSNKNRRIYSVETDKRGMSLNGLVAWNNDKSKTTLSFSQGK